MIDSFDDRDWLSEVDPAANFLNIMYPGTGNLGSRYCTVDGFQSSIDGGDLTISNYNIRSSNKNIDSFLSLLSSSKVFPDIVVLTETLLSESVEIEGYKSFHSFRTERRSGGVSVFVRQCYTCLLYTSPSPRDKRQSRMPSSA